VTFDLISAFRDRGKDPNRKANLDSALTWWEDHGITPIMVDDGRSGEDHWNRSAAYNRGAQLSAADVLVYSEADMLLPVDQIHQGVQLATEAPGLVVPFSRFMAMTEHDSNLVRERQLHPSQAAAEQIRGDRQSIGAVNIVSRETLATIVRFDEKFEGHAYDDDATERALSICAGPTRFIDGPAWHQWHVPGAFYATPESTRSDRQATARNKARWGLYRGVRTPDQIRKLTCESAS